MVMAIHLMANGQIIKKWGSEFTLGLMAKSMREDLSMIWDKVEENIFGTTDNYLKDGGRAINSTDKVVLSMVKSKLLFSISMDKSKNADISFF